MKSFVLLRGRADRSYFKVIFNAKTRNVPNCIRYNEVAGWQSLLSKSFQPRMGNQIPMKPECTRSTNHSKLPLIYACLYTSSLSYARCHCELCCGAWCNPSAGKRWLRKTGDKEPGPARAHSPEPFHRPTGCVRTTTLRRNDSIWNTVLMTLGSTLLSRASLRVVVLYRQILSVWGIRLKAGNGLSK